ncbi:MAG: hypothetical protein WKG01_35430 [Kofleriaceae bacterium]
MTLAYFQRLGDAVLAQWQQRGFEPGAFAGIATAALAAAPPSQHVSSEDIVRWVLDYDDLVAQKNLEATFGQPPVTVFHHDRFYIEALFWLSSTTSIHQHAFAGAFSVLAGSSVQTRYRFEPRAEVERRLRFGTVSLRDVKILRPGDVETIELDGALIHSVFHLEHPSVTIVVRTGTKLTDEPQYAYYPPSVAVDVLDKCPQVARRLQFLELLRETDPVQHRAAIRSAVAAWSPYAAFRVLELEARRSDDLAVLDELIALARDRHGAEFASLRQVFARRRRELIVSSRRASVSEPDLRFFLAVLLVLPDRASVYAALAAEYPGVDPRSQALAFAHRLSGTAIVGVELDELNTILFECLVDGADFAGAIRRLRAEYDDDSVDGQLDELAVHYRALAACELFEPLFDLTTVQQGGLP